MTDKIIITCAVTGSIHTPTMSPHLPVTPAEIAGQAIGAAEAGAAILHLHARNPETGQPSAREADFMAFLPEIKAGCGAVLNLSTGGSAIMSLEDRLAGPLKAEPEMCSLNMGTMNFALYPLADRYDAWVHDWEQPFLRGTDDLVFKNTPRDIEFVLTQMGQQRGARFEFECYDVGHLYMLRHFADRGLVKPPYFIQFVFGVLGGIGADPENLQHMKRMADKLFGDDYVFSVLAAGRQQIPFATIAASMGGHVRVGLEDNLYIAKGKLARSNAEQVTKIRKIVEELGRTVATPEEARQMLGLKGAGETAF
ncbi:3-keto-5-aminohexanoate cleavage protein [Labrenzia sp. PO1]|uniref:3-keto-5-aminohexanoate cleavage protein n=1 Tax=unclassified Labrenzia TaxID=2648686 RepID=UPI0003B90019|nr:MULTISPECIES: 3-keto-5-aminohexanoate cleavage protein [unclassified Labrenzia]ERP88510.1 3-keto-5-aminohexanoate cleavage protein [Labrenzia sp. C1B10]ERP99544.1 3-keto-5-aminohexanoate cleavage protein [Labrenzia sp. C1B70]NKI58671.1 3-keto-5-aminohexanoate cleavage protein [Labrenzia sp. PO1]